MKALFVKLLLFAALLCVVAQPISSQPPPPPGDHGSEQNENPFQQAPIGNGLLLLFSLAAAYAFTRSFRCKAKEPNQQPKTSNPKPVTMNP